MATYTQNYAPISDTAAHQAVWAQFFGQGFTTIGWVAQSGHGEVVATGTGAAYAWTTPALQTVALNPASVYTFRGAWVAGTAYTGNGNPTSNAGPTDLATNGGITYQCIFNTQAALTAAVQNTTIGSRAIQSITAAASGLTVYTFLTDSSAANAWQNYVFVIASATNSLNNGTFICTASTATTLTLANSVGVAQAGAVGNSTSSNANLSIVGAFSGVAANTSPTGFADNQAVGLSITTTLFTTNSGQNNTTGTIIASHTNAVAIVFAGTNETNSSAKATLNTAPASSTQFWQPYNYEIWKSSGAMTTLPIYVRLVYCSGSSVNGVRMHIGVGTGIDSSGNLTGAVTLSATAPVGNAPTDTGQVGSATVKSMAFSGDADNVRFIAWQATGQNNASFGNLLAIDRAKTATGADTDAYVYVGAIIQSSGTIWRTSSAIVLNPTFGGIVNTTGSGWNGVVSNGFITSSTSQFGAVPPYPIFPNPGFLGNPCLGVMGFNFNDVADGSIQSVWLYGGNHNYLVNSVSGTILSASLLNVANTLIAAIRWE